jgi:hypothetical protein
MNKYAQIYLTGFQKAAADAPAINARGAVGGAVLGGGLGGLLGVPTGALTSPFNPAAWVGGLAGAGYGALTAPEMRDKEKQRKAMIRRALIGGGVGMAGTGAVLGGLGGLGAGALHGAAIGSRV